MRGIIRLLARYLPAILTLAILAIVFGWLYDAVRGLRYANRIYVPVQDSYQVVAIGDSLVEGVGATRLYGFVSMLSDRLEIEIYNAGIRSERTAGVLSRLETDVIAYDPEVVILVIGANDMLRGVPTGQVAANLGMIIERLRTKEIDVIYGSVKTGFWKESDSYLELERVAREHGAYVVSNILDDILFDKDLLSDPLHPNDAGYGIMADRFEPVLRQVLEKRIPDQAVPVVE